METLRRNIRGAVIIGALIAFLGVVLVYLIPNADVLKQYGELMQSMPAFLINMVGGADAQFMASPEGLLALGFYGRVNLIFAIYALVAGLNITANEEDRGIMDVLLTTPLPRWYVIVEKFVAYALIMILIALISWLGLWLTTRTSNVFVIDGGRLFEATINLVPGSLVVIAVSALIATIVRRRGTATALAAAFVAFSYFGDVLGMTASDVAFLRKVSFFSYYDSTALLQTGTQWSSVIGLLVVAVIAVIGSVWAWQRRDVGV
ncbi:MAG: ABC transporter permease subunit [Anaerolineae bacterium]